MAKLVLTDVYVNYDSSVESDHVKSITFEVSADVPDATAMSEEWSNALVGTKSVNLSIEFYADFASGDLSEDIWTAWEAGTAKTIIVNPDGDTTSTANPKFTGSYYVASFPVVSGSHGDVAMMPVQFALADGAGITRATT